MDSNKLRSSTRNSVNNGNTNILNRKDENNRAYYGKVASTPSNDNQMINKFFPSPTENASFIQGEIENHIGLNGSDLTVNSVVVNSGANQNRVQIKSIPLLINNNINNISSNSNNGEDIISCQRIRKVVISNESSDHELKAKEEYLNHLRSIDLNKFSFPNETKPRTDYTYAKTSSYLMESKAVYDNCEMPNLCRRGRKSPQSQSNMLSLSSSNMNPSNTNNNKSLNSSTSPSSSNKKFFNLFTSSNINDFNRASNNTMETSQNRIAWYSYLINMFSSNNSNHNNQTNNNNQNQLNSARSTLVTSKLNKNLLQDLDDENNINFTLKHGYGLDRDSRATTVTSDGASTSTAATASTQATISRSASTSYNLRSSKRSNDMLNLNNPNQIDVNQEFVNIQERHGGRGKSICCSPWILLLMLLLFTGAGLFAFKSYDTTGLFSRLNELQNKIQPEPIIEKIKEPIQNLKIEPFVENIKSSSHKFFELMSHLQDIYITPYINWTKFDELWQITYETLTHYFNVCVDYSFRLAYVIYEYSIHIFKYLIENCKDFWLFLMKKKDYLSKPSIDYKLSTSNINTENNQELIEQFNLIKENIIAETIFKNEKIKSADIEQLRIDLDQKFNYTLTLMSNKLADQSVQHEKSKMSQEKELQQIKEVLDKLQSDYKSLIGQIEEQQKLILNQQKLVQQQQATTTSAPVAPTPTLNSNELVSFQKIEEYINRSFFLYNADRTGMTDFASESLGGSILFTRCTENYLHNSRWFTFFNVPISRITVSPRVVIQGTIQPGNCWAFKGDKADLFIKLAAPITPKSFSIEHIPKELSLTGVIDSAPQNFTVYGFVNPDDISDDNRLILGNFRYDNTSKNTLQFFDAQYQYSDKPITAVELKIESNAGNPDYTCLYKFRVHGQIFSNDGAHNFVNKNNEANLNQQQPKQQLNDNINN